MGLENPTYISDLVPTNPVSTDKKGQGDDHIRNLKTALQNTFPTASKALYFPTSATKTADFAILATNQNTTFLVDTTAGAVIGTLPTLVAGDAGWECFFIKTNVGLSPLFVAPPSGTLQSGALTGLATARRCIPGVRTNAMWTGTAWILSRAVNVPVGTVIDFDGATLPVGYELPNGQVLAGVAGSLYPDYYAQKGSLATRDITGRVVAMLEAAATRLTTIDGHVLGTVGGEESHTLTALELPVVTPAGVNAASALSFSANKKGGNNVSGSYQGGGGGNFGFSDGGDIVGTAAGQVFTGTPFGHGDAHNNVQPTIVLNKLLVVE